MITGIVNSALEATFSLLMQDANGLIQAIDVVLDTGFNGSLTLRPAQLVSLGATWICRQRGVLADGSIHVFDVYTITVIWDGQPRNVEVESADTAPPRRNGSAL